LPPITANWFKVLMVVSLAETQRCWTTANGKCCTGDCTAPLPQVIYIDFCDSLFCSELHFWRAYLLRELQMTGQTVLSYAHWRHSHMTEGYMSQCHVTFVVRIKKTVLVCWCQAAFGNDAEYRDKPFLYSGFTWLQTITLVIWKRRDEVSGAVQNSAGNEDCFLYMRDFLTDVPAIKCGALPQDCNLPKHTHIYMYIRRSFGK
jgi:hypothetical protein